MAATATAPQEPKQLNLNLDYFKTPGAQMRIAQGALALAALICTVEGECKNDQGRFAFFLLALVITIIEAIVVIIIFVLYLDQKVSAIINLPMTFLLNDSIILLCYFINSTLAMLSIGKCRYKIEARVMAALFAIALFIVYIGLTYTSFRWWEKSNSSKETSNNGSTTITESSPTVLT